MADLYPPEYPLMEIVLLGLIASLVLLIGVEGWLRSRYGLGNPLLYVADPEIGYVLAPSQQTRRHGNQILINEYSMRSGAVAQPRPEHTLRLLLLGDSVANGGWWTDQSQTISALLERSLVPVLPDHEQVEVLNASANSWGPQNELAYLKRFGTFEAQLVIVLLNTDDLFAAPPSPRRVGRDPSYPDRPPLLALVEVAQRLWPQRERWSEPAPQGDPVTANLAALSGIHAIAPRLVLAMTPLRRELSGSRDYERVARQRLVELTQRSAVPYVDFLPIFQAMPEPEAFYQDHIHLNLRGNAQVVETLRDEIQSMLFITPSQERS